MCYGINARGKKRKGKIQKMAHQLFVFHSVKEIPIDIVNKASDLVSLFRDGGEWSITKHKISYG